MLRSGGRIGPYTLVERLGQGQFGIVWLAERRTTLATTLVALKIPLDDEVNLESIKQEAKLWVKASGHPNILPIIEANIYDGQVIIASEFAPHGSLRTWLNYYGGKAPSIDTAIEITSGILAGLQHLHKRHIIHRDLKPANIVFQGTTPRLTDFGLSRILTSTRQSSMIGAGTPLYMAPEAFVGQRGVQTDIWSAGVILYEMLTAQFPFQQNTVWALELAVRTQNPAPLPKSVPHPLHRIIMKSLSKDLRQRYKSVSEIQSDIREFVLLRTKLYSTKKLENPSRRIDKVMKVEQGTVGWEWDGNEYEARDFEIVFRPGFKTPPIVHTSFVLLDTSDAGDHTSRYWVSVRDVSAERAKIKVGTWNKNKLWGCKIAWLALGE